MILKELKPIIGFATKELKERIISVNVDCCTSYYICDSYDMNNNLMLGYDVTDLIIGNNRDSGAWIKAKSEDNLQKFKIHKSNNVTVLEFYPC